MASDEDISVADGSSPSPGGPSSSSFSGESSPLSEAAGRSLFGNADCVSPYATKSEREREREKERRIIITAASVGERGESVILPCKCERELLP